jgi:hypothetical protein
MSRSSLPLASIALLLSAAPLAAVEPEAAVNDARQFHVECRITDATSGKRQVRQCPKVTLFEHQKAAISDLVLRPFVIAVSPAGDGAPKPQIEVLPEGLTIDLCCHGSEAGSVTLDVTLEESKITKVRVAKLDDKTSVQQPQVEIVKRRQFLQAESGSPFTISLDGQPAGKSKRWADFVVIELGSSAK